MSSRGSAGDESIGFGSDAHSLGILTHFKTFKIK